MSIINHEKRDTSLLLSAECIAVEDMGVMDTKFGKKPMVKFTFETDQTNQYGQKRRLTRLFHKHFHSMSALSTAAKAWCNRDLAAEDECIGVDFQTFVGSPALIKIEPGAEKGGRHYDNIVEILPINGEEVEMACEPKDNE